MRENIKTEKDYTDWMVKTGGYAKDMTLRDHFAGLAMQAYVMDEAILRESNTSAHWLTKIAECAYKQADTMLEERNHVKKKDIEENNLYNTSVGSLILTMRAENCLRAGGIKTLGELLQCSRNNLMRIPNLGKRTLIEIEEMLANLNLKLRGS